MAAATTRCGATPRRGGGAVRHRRRRPMCRWCSRRARPIRVRLEPRVRGAGGGDDQGHLVAHVRLPPQLECSWSALSAREPGDGVRRPRLGHSGCSRGPAGEAALAANMKPSLQTVLIDKQRAPTGASCAMCGHYLVEPNSMHAGKRDGRRGRSRTKVDDHPLVGSSPRGMRFKIRRAQRLALGPVRRLRTGVIPTRCSRTGLSGGVRGRASVPGRLSRAVRRLPRGPGSSVSKTCLVRFEQQQVQRTAGSMSRSMPTRSRHPLGSSSPACPALRPKRPG